MSIFQRDKGLAAPAPVVPPKPTKEELDNPSRHSQNRQQPGDGPKMMGVMEVMQKVNPFKSTSQASSTVSKAASPGSVEHPADSAQSPGMLKGVMQKVNPFKSASQVPKVPSSESLEQGKEGATQSAGMLKGMMQKVNPFKSSAQNPGMITGMIQNVKPFGSSEPKDVQPLHSDLSSSTGNLADNKSLPEKQENQADIDNPTSSESLDDSTIERHTFRLKRILPTGFFGSGTKDSANASSDTEAPPQVVEVQTLQLAEIPIPGEGVALDPLDDEEGLFSWWSSVEGWDEWNEANQNDETEEVVEQAADRVFMAARLFVRFFNQRGALLQQRILELLALADAADNFHKKTVTASIGGGVASVAGSVTTITGLILAPFTAGTSLIVTAVGIGIATAGGVTSASANITDTVHSKMDRKKVEKIIQDYQKDIKDIKECLEFLQEGMETLEQWDFEKYAESIAKNHLNQNVKHVMREGGRAGKALVINTESLINTVQVLSVAGGAAKAAQVMSITTGVMSGLFLALDMFFLAKDSMELKKGAKTDFAVKIREVCKDLQNGLLELNNIKEQLQKTIDGIEVEIEEEEDEEQLKSDLKKLVELEE